MRDIQKRVVATFSVTGKPIISAACPARSAPLARVASRLSSRINFCTKSERAHSIMAAV